MRLFAFACSLVAAAFAATPASGAIVGSTSTLNWTIGGSQADSRSFLVSALLPEYYRADTFSGGYQALLVDLREDGLALTADFAGAPVATFAPGTVIRIELPESVDITAFTVTTLTQSSGLTNANLTYAGRVLEIDMSNLQFSQPGGRADLVFSFVPSPGAVSLILAAGRVLNLGRGRN